MQIPKVLTGHGQLEHFFPETKDVHIVEAVRRTFAGMWGLEHDDAETRRVVQVCLILI